jgi:hypothetical protein
MIFTSMRRLKQFMLPMLALLILILWMISITWGYGYANLHWRDLLNLGYINKDIVFHSAYAHMLATYGKASTGLDGLPYVPYHFGSHLMAGVIARLLHTSTLTVYNFVFPWLLPFLYIIAFMWFVISLRPRADWRTNIPFWILIVAGTVRILPQPIADTLGMWNSMFVSESAVLGQTIFFLGAGALARGWADRSRFFRLIGLPALCLALGLSKQSLLFIAVVGLGVLLLSEKRWMQKKYWPSVALVAFATYVSYRAASGTYQTIEIAPFDFVSTWTQTSVPIWLLVNFGWAWLYVGLRLIEKRRPFTDLYVLAALIIAGLIPALSLKIPGGSAAYFTEIQRFVAVGLLAAWLPNNIWQQKGGLSRYIKLAFIIILTPVFFNFSLQVIRFTEYNKLSTNTQNNPVIDQVINQLNEIAAIPPDVRSQTGLVIERTHPYWSILNGGCFMFYHPIFSSCINWCSSN